MEYQHGRAYQHMEKGLHLERQGLLDEAMLEFKHAIEADPSMPMAHHALGQHYQRKGLLTKAADEFHTASLLSDDFDCYFSLGRALTDLDRFPEACEAFEACLRLDAEDPSARYELAYVQYAAGEIDQALAGFRSLLDVYPDDWELKLAIANCHISRKEFPEARDTLLQGLSNAPAGADTTSMRDALVLVERHLEFGEEPQSGVKGQLYGDFGVVCLGSGQDDGMDIPVYADHAFSLLDIARTLARFHALVREFDWRFTAVVSSDPGGLPLALALAEMVNAPLIEPDQAQPDDLVLLVSSQLVQPELYDVILEHLPAHVLSFALTAPWQEDRTPAPDILGVPCQGSCGLQEQDYQQCSPSSMAELLLRTQRSLPPEENIQQQMAYYVQHHTRLRFLEATAEPVREQPE
jgi:tetratricopeptide (TPR) repeat protein